jgi:hypothetical protein
VWLALSVGAAAAQQTSVDTISPEMRRVDGKVQLGKRSGAIPAVGVWVVVHRIGPDRSGPLDSARVNAAGRYDIRYKASGSTDAIYLAVATYRGIAYITSPLRLPRVTGDDAQIIVYDTTSPPYPLRVAGRHLVVTTPDADGRRRVIEVYEIMNDSTFTVLSTEKNPAWRVTLPANLKDLQLNPAGDVTAGNVKQNGDALDVFAPISPGMRQLSFSYTLPGDAFPLSVPVTAKAELMEVLVQEPDAVVTGGGLTEVAPVFQEGATFRRLIAQDVKANSVLRLTVPTRSRNFAAKTIVTVATILAALMAAALLFAFSRRRRAPVVLIETTDPTDDLLREMATLDAKLQHAQGLGDAERGQMLEERARLKAKVADALARL